MKCIFAGLLSGLLALVGVLGSNEGELRFLNWMQQQNKTYRSADEYLNRWGVFRENAKLVDEHNAESHPYSLELNFFADLTFREFQLQYLSAPQKCSATNGSYERSNYILPEHVDWRKRGVVSPVKNQGGCGSCWTFSTTGCMEAHVAIKYRKHLSLSEQQLVDCAGAFNNHGCQGGLPSQAFEYIHYNHGIMSEASYPYKGKDGKCKFVRRKAVAFVSKIVNITQFDEDALADAVASAGPVSIAFMVASDFHMYKSGVYSSTICKKDPMHVNHAVLAVGFDQTRRGKKYWIVKNSWGASWGLHGYFNIERGRNMCGLSDCASYPIVTNK